MNVTKDDIIFLIAIITMITISSFCIHSCVVYDSKETINRRAFIEVCKQKCLPKPYDPKYIPDQCVCMEGEAK